MPYNKHHKAKSRQRILASAYKLFSSQGYENVSINAIMSDAGLTRGAFYAHFDNKSTLYHDSIIYAADTSKVTCRKPDNMNSETWLRELLNGYLHKNNLADTCECPLASLVTDVVVRDSDVRKAYTSTFKDMNKIFNKHTESFSSCSRDTVLAATAMIIGGLAVARALDDPNLADQLLDTCRENVWNLLNDV